MIVPHVSVSIVNLNVVAKFIIMVVDKIKSKDVATRQIGLAAVFANMLIDKHLGFDAHSSNVVIGRAYLDARMKVIDRRGSLVTTSSAARSSFSECGAVST